MAVSLSVAELVNALRLGSTAEETAEVTRLLAFASEVVMKHAPNAPTTIQNEAAIRLAAYEYDAPNAGRGAGYADRLRNSGALATLAPWRVHRAGSTGEDQAEDELAVAEARGGVALPGVVSGEPTIVSVGSIPSPVATRGVGRYQVRSRGPAVVFVAVAVQSPGDGITLNKGDATVVLVDSDAGTRLWLWTDGGMATATVVYVQ